MRSGGQSGFRRGLTLVELLVSIAVLGVIVTIALVALRSAKRAGHEARTIAHAKTHANMHQSWHADHDSVFLNLGVHHPTFLQKGCFENDNTMVYLVSLSGKLLHLWYPQQAGYPTWAAVVQAWTGEGYGPLTPFQYGFAFFTDRRLWAPDNTPWAEWPAVNRFQFVRVAETAHPSDKGLLRSVLNTRPLHVVDTSAERHCIAFVDGSAGVFTVDAFVEPHSGFFGGEPSYYPEPVLYTVDGVLGRDVRR